MASVHDNQDAVSRHLRASAEVKNRAADACAFDTARAAAAIAGAIAGGGKILLCGNGGSAADCQHMAAEFVSRLTKDFPRPGIPAIALTTDTSFLTAFANDNDFHGAFARQVETLGRPGDVLIGISTSGASRNVIAAIERARAGRLIVIALVGRHGVIGDMADVAIRVPADSTQHVQECHLAIEHVICFLVERALYPPA